MRFTDKNNNLTLFILLLGCIILVLFYKSKCLKNNEGFQDQKYTPEQQNSFYVKMSDLKNLNRNIQNEKIKTDMIKRNINLLKNNKSNDVLFTSSDKSKKFYVPSDLNTNELVKYRNEIKLSSNNLKTDNIQKKINSNKNQQVKKELLAELNDLQTKYSNLNLNQNSNKSNESNEYKSIKNPYINTNLKVSKVNPINSNSTLKPKDRYLIHLNNDCLSFDKTVNNQNEMKVNNYTLKQCNVKDETQHMTIDHFKHIPKIEKKPCIKNNLKSTFVDTKGGNENKIQEELNQNLDTSSYVSYFNKFISNDFDKLNETRKQYYSDEIAVVQPYIDESQTKSKINCLTVEPEGISFQDCRLDKSQTWIPRNTDTYC